LFLRHRSSTFCNYIGIVGIIEIIEIDIGIYIEIYIGIYIEIINTTLLPLFLFICIFQKTA